MNLRNHPYADFLHEVSKPARYLGGERFAVAKDWSGLRAKMVLAFPDVYDIGMSHLGTKILYKIVNDDRGPLPGASVLPVDRHGGGAPQARACPFSASRPLARSATSTSSASRSSTSSPTPTFSRCSISAGSRCDSSREDARIPLVIAGGPVATPARADGAVHRRLPDRRRARSGFRG